MNEEIEVPEVEVPEAEQPEAPAPEAESPPPQKETVPPSEEDHVRKRIDKIVWQREEARREAEHWKRLANQQKPVEEKPVEDPTKPRADQFQSFEEYTEALTEWKVESRLKKAQEDYQSRSQQERFLSAKQQFDERAEKVREQYPDYDELFESAAISEAMAPTILESEQGPELAMYLAKNPEVARKIYRLGPTQAARELGKIEAKLDDLLQPKTVTDAKPPLKPVKPKGDAPDGLDDDLDIKTWMKRRNKQVGR